MNNLLVIGQIGNWLFHTAAGIKMYGDVKKITACADYNRFKNSERLWKQITNIPIARTINPWNLPEKSTIHAKTSNWQSLEYIPSREECRNIFKVPSYKVLDNVVHVRGGDYLTYFKKTAETITIGKEWLLKIAHEFGCAIEELNVVTDDIRLVKSFNLPVKIISNDIVSDWLTLANAKKLAISPSTFSWWAGFLGKHEQVLIPEGIGPWDLDVLKNDPYSAHSNSELCWGDECKCIKL